MRVFQSSDVKARSVPPENSYRTKTLPYEGVDDKWVVDNKWDNKPVKLEPSFAMELNFQTYKEQLLKYRLCYM